MIYRFAISSPQLRHVSTAKGLSPVLVPAIWRLPSSPVSRWSRVMSAGYNSLLVEARWLAAFVRKARAGWVSSVFTFLSALPPEPTDGLVFHIFTQEQLEAIQDPVDFQGCPSGFTAKARLVVWWFSYWTAQFCGGREPVFLFAGRASGDDVRQADIHFKTGVLQ